jgi:hypothetical protein
MEPTTTAVGLIVVQAGPIMVGDITIVRKVP